LPAKNEVFVGAISGTLDSCAPSLGTEFDGSGLEKRVRPRRSARDRGTRVEALSLESLNPALGTERFLVGGAGRSGIAPPAAPLVTL
jgi:hypothetical protein